MRSPLGTGSAPRTAEELALRDEAPRSPAGLPSGGQGRSANSALTLPDYSSPFPTTGARGA